MNTYLQKTALVGVYLLAIVFSLKNMLEPDLWWQLRTGEWILETGNIPTADPFSYTYAGTPWQNIKWGFEVIIALLSKTMGLEMLMMVQVICSIGIVYFFGRLIRLMAPSSVQPITYLVVGLSFILLEYRITGRPETITHLFFLMLCTILLENRLKPSRITWWIPLIMMVWANLHEAFGIGLVVLIVFAASAWFEASFSQTQSKKQAIHLTAIFALSLASICINPHFVQILLKPFEIAGQVYENKYTTEFTTYTQPMFWTKEAWGTVGILAYVAVVLGIRFVRSKGSYILERVNAIVPLPFVILLPLLVYLGSTGHRNIIFTTLMLIPLLVPNVLLLVQKIKFNVSVQYGITILVLLVLYVSVVTNTYYRFSGSKSRYGLEVPAYATPVGAAHFLEQQQLTDRPVFSDYLSSSYLLWRLQPSFKTFIDLRDLDVFPAAHFDLFAQIITNPAVFEKTDSQYHFGSVVLLRAPQMQTLHSYLYNHPVYRLRYMDAVCCVYVKDSSLSSLTTYNPLEIYPQCKAASIVTKIFNPWFNSQNPDGMDEVLSAGEYYYDAGNNQLAIAYAQRSVESGVEPYRGLELLGQIAYQAFTYDTSATRQQRADSATTYFNKAYKLKPEYVPVLIDLGVKAFNEQQYKSAIAYLKKACAVDPDNLKAQRNMAEVYKTVAISKGDQKMLELAIDHFNNVDHMNPHNPDIMMNLGFLYFRSGDCDNTVKFLEQVVDYPGITELQRSRARECILKCR